MEQCKNKTKTYKQKRCLLIKGAPEHITVLCSPLYVGTGVKEELAHSTTKPNTQSTSDTYADRHRYPRRGMTFSKLYGTLGPGIGPQRVSVTWDRARDGGEDGRGGAGRRHGGQTLWNLTQAWTTVPSLYTEWQRYISQTNQSEPRLHLEQSVLLFKKPHWLIKSRNLCT